MLKFLVYTLETLKAAEIYAKQLGGHSSEARDPKRSNFEKLQRLPPLSLNTRFETARPISL